MPIVKIIPMPGPKGPVGPGNIDGGRAGSIYTIVQKIDGGNAASQHNEERLGG